MADSAKNAKLSSILEKYKFGPDSHISEVLKVTDLSSTVMEVRQLTILQVLKLPLLQQSSDATEIILKISSCIISTK